VRLVTLEAAHQLLANPTVRGLLFLLRARLWIAELLLQQLAIASALVQQLTTRLIRWLAQVDILERHSPLSAPLLDFGRLQVDAKLSAAVTHLPWDTSSLQAVASIFRFVALPALRVTLALRPQLLVS